VKNICLQFLGMIAGFIIAAGSTTLVYLLKSPMKTAVIIFIVILFILFIRKVWQILKMFQEAGEEPLKFEQDDNNQLS
jgi:hypothetical protein